jgi:hypothetical protein
LLCDVIVLNVHTQTEDEIDDLKDRFYEELEGGKARRKKATRKTKT